MAMPMTTLSGPSSVLRAFTRQVSGRLGVRKVCAIVDERHCRVWVLLDRWDRETRFGVYVAQNVVDPDGTLEVMPTDAEAEIPADAMDLI